MLVSGWNDLMDLLGNGGQAIFTIAAVIGVVVLLASVLGWLWQRRKGSVSVGGFPWMAVIVGAVLAGPKVVIPVLLGIGDALIGLGKIVLEWITGQF